MPMWKRFEMAVITGLLASPLAALAQGVPQGAQRGAEEGSAVGGPVGGAVGGPIRGIAGGIGGLLGVGQVPRFHDYVIREHRSVYIPGVVPEVGMILPPGGITYAVPPEFRVALRYRYAIVNDHVVLINPGTREVVQVIK
jgi:Protein of unknown function (DUF1236)